MNLKQHDTINSIKICDNLTWNRKKNKKLISLAFCTNFFINIVWTLNLFQKNNNILKNYSHSSFPRISPNFIKIYFVLSLQFIIKIALLRNFCNKGVEHIKSYRLLFLSLLSITFQTISRFFWLFFWNNSSCTLFFFFFYKKCNFFKTLSAWMFFSTLKKNFFLFGPSSASIGKKW